MKTKRSKPKVRDLNQLGYKRTTVKGLYITNNGKAYNYTTHRNLKVNKGRLVFNGKEYNLAKLVLETFSKITMRGGCINFINGNQNDFLYTNLEYKTTIKQFAPNEKDLIKCIRFYFKVDKKFHSKSILFKYYMHQISLIRGFDIRTEKTKGSILFFEWLSFRITGESQSIYSLSRKHSFTATNGKNEVYKYYNLLINETIEDFNKGFLQLKPFNIPVRKKSIKQHLKDFSTFCENLDKEVNEQIEHLENIKETIKQIPKKDNHSHFFIDNEFLFESYNTIRGLRFLQVMPVLGMPNEKECSDYCLFYIVKEYL
jgi:hypothetical protein